METAVITARFYVVGIEYGPGEEPTARVRLSPSYKDGRNAEWSKATPSASMEMTVTNQDAIKKFDAWRAGSTDLHITIDAVTD